MEKKQNQKTVKSERTYTRLLVVGLGLIIILLVANTVLNRLLNRDRSPLTSTNEKLELVSTEPPQGDHKTILSTYPIKFRFNYPLQPNSVKVETSLQRQIFISFEDNNHTLVLSPKIGWELKDSQTITIQEAVSDEGFSLSKPIIYSFRIIAPTIGPDHYWNEPNF